MALRQKIFESNNKGLFDVAVGEGNISANFATELQNSRVALNGEVSKRRGRTYFNNTAIPSTPDVIGLMIYDGNYPGTYEVLAQAGTDLLRYDSSASAFNVTVKSGLTVGKKLNWTMFNNKMILTNGVDNPFKYGYTPKPFQPTTSTTTAGAKNTRTYYISITYVTANGESVVSEEVSQAIGANDVLIVNSPVSIPGVTGWNVYHHTVSGSLKLQNATPIAIGSNYQESTGALDDGASPPTIHTGWYVADLGDNPPKAKYVYALNNRVWMAGIDGENTRFSGCSVDNEDDWSTPSDYVNINLASVLARGDTITGLGRLGQSNSLIIGLQNHIVTYKVPATFNDIAIDKQVFNTGVMSHRGIDEVGLDNYIVETEGLNSVKMELIVQGLKTKKLSDKIRDRINPILKDVADPAEVNVVNHKAENEFWVNIPSVSRRYIYDYEIKAWMEDRDVKIFQSVRTPDNQILSAGSDGRVFREYTDSSGVNVYGDGNDDVDVAWKWQTPWLWFDNISIKKMFKYFQFKGTGADGLFNLDVSFDFTDEIYKTFYLQSTSAQWDASAWEATYWDFPDVNKVLIPMVGMGRAVRFLFSATHQADLSIAFYGVKYANAGFRAND